MSEQEQEKEDQGGDTRAGAHGALATMTSEQALSHLRTGRPLENVRVEKLVFRGEFVQPIRLKNCVLIRPRFDSATFQTDVTFQNCTLEHPYLSRENVFNGDLSFRGSTLTAVQLPRVTV